MILAGVGCVDDTATNFKWSDLVKQGNMCGSVHPCNENHCNCSKCVHWHETFMNHWILDSGASMHFTTCGHAFTTHHKFSKDKHLPMQTATSTIFVERKGTIQLRWINGHKCSHDIEVHDVGHMYTQLWHQSYLPWAFITS